MGPYTKTYTRYGGPDGSRGWLILDGDASPIASLDTETLADRMLHALLNPPAELPRYDPDVPYGESEEDS